jgi:putative membrane protein
MSIRLIPLLLVVPVFAYAASSPDAKFYKHAAEGGLAEVELGQLAQKKSQSQAVQDFGALMVKDHSAANEKLQAIAAGKGLSLPTSPSIAQAAAKGKLEVLSGHSFDKSYIKGMVKDHKEDIAEFNKEATSGQDPDAKAFATATLPTLKEHLQKIQSIAKSAGVSVDEN